MQPTVLLVDSYDSSRVALCELLREWGYRVVPARNGVEGLHAAREQRPAAVIVDLWPYFSASLQMVERLRATPATEQIPVLVLTSAVSPTYRRRALDAGCQIYLEKPCPADQLQTQLRRVLGFVPVSPGAFRLTEMSAD